MKRKILLSLFAILSLFMISGCGKKTEVPKSVKSVEGNKTVKPNITETIIMDSNGVKVTAKSINYNGILGPEIKILVENNSQETIGIEVENFSINGLMIYASAYGDVAAGKKANETIDLSLDDLKISGITTVKDIEFDFEIYRPENYETIHKETGIKLQTNATDYVQNYNTSGTLAVDQDGVKVYVLKRVNTNSFWGSEIYVYIENNTDDELSIQADEVSVNGFMIDPYFSTRIPAGKKAYEAITFMESDLKANEITDIEEIELKFKAIEYDSYSTIFTTDVQKITFN